MPYSNKQMLRDANGDLIPQYWDVVEQEFKPLTGRDGANDVRITGSNVEELVFNGVTVAPGSTSQRIYFDDVARFFKEFIFVVRAEIGHTYSVDVLWNMRYPGTFPAFREFERFEITSRDFRSDPLDFKSERPSIRINNDGTAPHQYDLSILWRR